MKKLLYLLALLLPLAGFTQNTRAFYGSSISRSYGVDTLAGFKAINTNTLGYAGLVAISAADTSAFFTNGTGHASIYNSAGVLRQPQYVGVGGSPDVSGTAYLSLTGTTGGFLTARMTAAQKNAIGSPATGLLIYQTDGTPGFYYYTGSAWSAVGGGSSGITVGTTTITSGTSGRLGHNLAGVYQESISYSFTPSDVSPWNVHLGFQAGTANSGGSYTGTKNVLIGSFAGKNITSGSSNAILTGYAGGFLLTTGSNNTVLNGGTNCLAVATVNAVVIGMDGGASTVGDYSVNISGTSSGAYGIAVGLNSTNSGANAIALGRNAVVASGQSIAIGGGATTTTTNQLVIGGNMGFGGIFNIGISSVYIGNGVTSTAPTSFTLNGTGGSGTNITGGNITIAGGISTGNATPGTFAIQTSTTLGSGTTLQSLVSRLTISGGAVTTDASTATWADKLDFVFSTGTGTKIGTGTTQKIGFWNATPIVQPTTAVAAATFVANTSGIVDDSATFDGYTIGQVVKALRNAGLLQ